MLRLKSEYNASFAIALFFFAVGSFLALGFTGLRTVSGMILLMFLPFYLIFNALNLTQSEKIAFSFFAGITLFPSLVYWLGFIVSFKISIFIVVIALLIAAYTANKFRKK